MDWFSKVREVSAEGARQLAPQRPLRSSKSLRMALAAMLTGAALWLARSDKTDGTPQSSQSGTPSSGFAQTADRPDQPAVAKERRLVPTSPALFRFGASFLGGFAIGFACRRFLKAVAWAAAVVLGGIALIKVTGLMGWDWAVMEGRVRESLTWTHSGVESLKALLTGYLPSAVAGFLGIFKGLRWK